MDTLPTVPKKSSKKKAKKSKSHSSEQSLAKMLTAYTDSLHRLEAQRPDPDVWSDWMSDWMMMSNRIGALLLIVCTTAIISIHLIYTCYYISLQLLSTATSGCSGRNWLK